MRCPECQSEMDMEQDIRIGVGCAGIIPVATYFYCLDCDQAYRLEDGRPVREGGPVPLDVAMEYES